MFGVVRGFRLDLHEVEGYRAVVAEHRQAIALYITGQFSEPEVFQLRFRRGLRQWCGSARAGCNHGIFVGNGVEIDLLLIGGVEGDVHEERVRVIRHVVCKVVPRRFSAYEGIYAERMDRGLVIGRRTVGFADGACPHVELHGHIVLFPERGGIFLDTPQRQQTAACRCSHHIKYLSYIPHIIRF